MFEALTKNEADEIVAGMLAAIRKEAYFEPPSKAGIVTFFPFLESALPYGALHVLDWYWPRFLKMVEVNPELFIPESVCIRSSTLSIHRTRWDLVDDLTVQQVGSLMGIYIDIVGSDLRENRAVFESQDERNHRVASAMVIATIFYGRLHWTRGECQDVEDVMRVFYGHADLKVAKGPVFAKQQEARIKIDKVLRSRKVPVERLSNQNVDC